MKLKECPAQVVLCSACSGHGYKFCSVIGELLADLVLKGESKHSIGIHRIRSTRPGTAELLQACTSPSKL
jgi:sarcosine oxidase